MLHSNHRQTWPRRQSPSAAPQPIIASSRTEQLAQSRRLAAAIRMAREALQLSDACDWSQHTRPPFQTFSTKKTSRLAALHGYGISSPANGASMCSPIPVRCRHTHWLWYSHTVPARSHVSSCCSKCQFHHHVRNVSGRGRAVAPDCTPFLPNKYFIPHHVCSRRFV